MEQKETLTMQEYCRLFEHIILAEYDNLFHNAELRQDLGLDHRQTGRFAVEYLSAALFLLEDLLPDSQFSPDIQQEIHNAVRANVFCSIMREDAPEGAEAQYILYSLKRGMQFAQKYRRDDEAMKLIIEDCLDQAQLTDAVARLPQSLYLMQLLPGLVQLFCDLVCCAQVEETDVLRFRIELPETTE